MKNTDQATIKSNGQVSPEKDVKQPENKPKLTKLDHAIVEVVKANQIYDKATIAKKVCNMGVTKWPESIYRRFAKNDYLKAEIQKVRDHTRQHVDRIIVPDALKVAHKVIKAKTMDDTDKALWKAKEPYVKLMVDKSFGDIKHIEQPATFSIESIQNMQVILQADLE